MIDLETLAFGFLVTLSAVTYGAINLILIVELARVLLGYHSLILRALGL